MKGSSVFRTMRARAVGAALLAGLALAPVMASADSATDALLTQLNGRLAALDANMDLGGAAAYERLQARQAVSALQEARRSDRETLAFVAQSRVETAETAARTGLARREVERLDRTRSELLIEASRREADRARQEAQQLRLQAQIQAEEAETLRLAAEQDAVARQQAEQLVIGVADQQTAKLSAARQKEASLSRQEAELVSGGKLPASRFESRGEVFTVPGSAFAAGKTTVAAGSTGTLDALAAYLQIGKGAVRVEAYDANAGVAQKRAEAIRAALVAKGVAKSRIAVAGKASAATKARSAEVIVAP